MTDAYIVDNHDKSCPNPEEFNFATGNNIEYSQSALIEKIKHELTQIKLDIQSYKTKIEKHRIERSSASYYYDYDLDLDFDTDPKIIDNRKYYYRAFHYQKIGLFKEENIPWLKISLLDLSLESLKALSQLHLDEREYVAKQAIGRIFEDINSDIYHNSISSILKVKFINGSNYDYVYTISPTTENSVKEYLEEKEKLMNKILSEQEEYFAKRESQIKGLEINNENSYNINESDPSSEINNIKEYNTNNVNNKELDLLDLIKEYCVELFVDQYNNPHIALKINDHVEVLSLKRRRTKNIIFQICYEKTGKLTKEKIENVIDILEAQAVTTGNIKPLDIRVGKTDYDEHVFYYDLTNAKWNIVKISSDGWSIIESGAPILFKRYTNQKPQVNPAIYDKDDVFDRFMNILNIKDKDVILLLKCYIISLFIPEISKPILMIDGEQGSTKSTFEELIKMLVDPSAIKTLSFPRDINQLIQQLSHNYIAYFDNISDIKDWISDELCRAVTGSGFSKRELFTDDDDIIYSFKRCIGFNGINLGATKADLLDRGIIIHLERIAKKNRRKIETILKEFDELKPQLLGYIFHILVKVLHFKNQYGEVHLPNGFNRMADFEEYAEIISRCMGNPDNEFIRVYQDNIEIQIDEAIEANLLSTSVIIFIKDIPDKEWKGTATTLLEELNIIAETRLKINIKNNSSWVKAPNQLSRKLNEIITSLREKGIIIEKSKDQEGNKIIKICMASSISSYSPEATDQAQDSNEMFDDMKQTIDKVSPKQEYENQSQKTDTGRFGDTADTLHTLEEVSRGDSDDVDGANNKFLYECYYCEKFAPTNYEIEYQRHVLNSHPQKRLYPLLSELEELGIKPKGKRWEI